MRITNLTILHAVVMLWALTSITVLGVMDKLSETSLVALVGPVLGVIFGAAASQSAANGSARAVVDAAIERGSIIEQDARRRHREAGGS